MRKIRERLRLHCEQKLGQRQIARGAGVSQSTVHEYLQRAQAVGIKWPLPEDWDEERLEAELFPLKDNAARSTKHPLLDFARIREQLERHRCCGRVSRAASGRLLLYGKRQSNPS